MKNKKKKSNYFKIITNFFTKLFRFKKNEKKDEIYPLW